MGHDEGVPQPQFSQTELVKPQDEGAQATYDPEDAIVLQDAFETGLGEVKGEDEMKSTECVPDPTQLAQPTQVPHAPQLPPAPQPKFMAEPPFAFPLTSAMRQAQWPHPNTAIVHVPHGSHFTLLLIYQRCYQKMVNAYGPCGLRWPPLEEKEASLKKYLHPTGTKTQASMYGAPYIALGTTIPSGNTHLQAVTGHEALGVLNSPVRHERGTKKSAHTGTKAGSKVLRWPRI